MLETFATLREHHVQVLTVGQYLRPTRDHLPVVRYWHPDEFAELEREAYAMGFESVAAGPLVRSSYHAEQTLERAAARLSALGPRSARGLRRRAGCAGVVVATGAGGRPPGRDRWRALRPAPLERTEVAAARIGRSIYVIGGFEQRSAAGRPRGALRHPRNSWKRVRSMPVG